MKTTRASIIILTLAHLATACGAQPEDAQAPTDPGLVSPGPTEKTDLTEDQQVFLQQYQQIQEEAAQMTPESFRSQYQPAARIDGLSYDPTAGAFFDEVKAFTNPNEEQLELLDQNGFAVLNHTPYRTFERAYLDLYTSDLPVFVTSDSVLYALHRSYDSILMDLELRTLVPEMTTMLEKMHLELSAKLDAASIPETQLDTAAEVDLYLAVARTLLTGTSVSTIHGAALDSRLEKILSNVASLQPSALTIFGHTHNNYDYSQMKPRGHYEQDEVLQRYFRAMMWLGRTQMELVTFADGQTIFRRESFDAAFTINTLLSDSGAKAQWDRVNLVIEKMVGEKDGMDPLDMVQFEGLTGITSLLQLAQTSDEDLRDALLKTPFGLQRIMSQIIYTNPNDPQVVLPRVFLLMGQRFVIDSYVFHHVTYDRIVDESTGQKVTRMLPSELDIQFALGSNAAGELLDEEIERWNYQGNLHELRFLVDSHPKEFWDANLYNGWLDALRSLNDETRREDQPEPMRTEAWGHKTLNTQLASWAELRHDTILYAKQSYTDGIGCHYPDAYVEPVPAFFERMGHLAQIGIDMSATLAEEGVEVGPVKEWFHNMAGVMSTLETIAQKELDATALSEEEYDFLRATIEMEMVGCGEENFDGWYASLFFNSADVGNFKPTIADVHTAPTDETGAQKGWVLHGATGFTRLMIFTMEDCEGVRTFVGPVSTYHSVLEENFTRKTDSEWEQALTEETSTPLWTESFRR